MASTYSLHASHGTGDFVIPRPTTNKFAHFFSIIAIYGIIIILKGFNVANMLL